MPLEKIRFCGSYVKPVIVTYYHHHVNLTRLPHYYAYHYNNLLQNDVIVQL